MYKNKSTYSKSHFATHPLIFFQRLTEEATTNGSPDAKTLKMISKAAFEVDDYWRIVDILHKRLVRFDNTNWRASYKALIVLEHLLTHGPDRVAEEFQTDTHVIRLMESFQHIDDQGFNWGLNVRKKCERILKLLEKGPLLKEEREKARKISRGIQGFGSFNLRMSTGQQQILDESAAAKAFGRSNSELSDHRANQEDLFSSPSDENVTVKAKTEKLLFTPASADSKENLGPGQGINLVVESKPLLGGRKDSSGTHLPMKDDHPFDETERLTAMSLLSTADEC
ncbi:clathrin interactor epsin 3 [Phtheirospermum japonicum]|uniref:Clathrin interactor epsin 3 n=1 Tax=Phtheirospermum japonicum TaxID=374723 RepID=A0A830B8V0_9LAMI|nr:clathrin interactor epsin 3 [Phtheirospermum japonicum]